MAISKSNQIYKRFTDYAVSILKLDVSVIGLAVGGSWLTREMDDFSDLDLILVTKEKVHGKYGMLKYAERLGPLLTAFTGEHVGEPRLLICLYNDPLLHVDIKFLTIDELSLRVENPYILHDTDQKLYNLLQRTEARFPFPDYQWIEDRFWTWIHYALLKIGRGEYFEALGFLGFLRMTVLGPLLHVKNGHLPRGVRKVETLLATSDVAALSSTIAELNRLSLISAIEQVVLIYRSLRHHLFEANIIQHHLAEDQVILFLEKIKRHSND